MKLELVLTRWEDGLFKSRDRIEVDSFSDLIEQFEFTIINMKDKIIEEQESKYKIAEDDDIPF